jgi:sterol desaturase/sphingolipid hydroxylase (fatty acid hydroxylase superfamily)
MELPNIGAYAVLFFVGLIIVEMIAVRVVGRGRYETKDTFASLTMGVGNSIVAAAGGSLLVYFGLGWVYQYRLIETIPVSWWAVLICFVAQDFAFYWFHRTAHEMRWFWASHVIHHSSQHYNLSAALRQTWTGQVTLSFMFYLPLAFIGFPPEMIIFVSLANLLYQFWIHTELIGRLGPLEWILNTPSHHRVHHGTNPRYLDANYAGTLIIWDKIFGTFIPESSDEKPRFGIIKNLKTFNPVMIALHEWIGIAKDLAGARSLKEVGGYLFGPPGWSPDGSRMTSSMIKERWESSQAASAESLLVESDQTTEK